MRVWECGSVRVWECGTWSDTRCYLRSNISWLRECCHPTHSTYQNVLHTLHHTMYTTHCIPHCAPHTVHRILYDTHCTPHPTVYHTLYNRHCTVKTLEVTPLTARRASNYFITHPSISTLLHIISSVSPGQPPAVYGVCSSWH